MAEDYITQYYTWITGDTITATRLNGNVSNLTDGLSGGTKAINIGKILVGGTEVLNSSREVTLTKATVDNIVVNGNDISSTTGDVTITPATGNDVVLDGHWNFDGAALDAITDNNTVITAYTGKNITIELVTIDGGVVTIPSTLNLAGDTAIYISTDLAAMRIVKRGQLAAGAALTLTAPSALYGALINYFSHKDGDTSTWTNQIYHAGFGSNGAAVSTINGTGGYPLTITNSAGNLVCTNGNAAKINYSIVIDYSIY